MGPEDCICIVCMYVENVLLGICPEEHFQTRNIKFLQTCKRNNLAPTFAKPKYAVKLNLKTRKRITKMIIEAELTNKHKELTELQRRGLMLVLSSPSGAGKTTIAHKVMALEPDLTMSISVTTRPKRPNEVDGKDYHFITTEKFTEIQEDGGFLEYAKVFDNHYGTLRKTAFDHLGVGKDILFDIDWQGTQQLNHIARADLVSIFILPPSISELESRLRQRAQDPKEIIEKRMEEASNEISHWAEYDYVVVNNTLDQSVSQVRSILIAERLKRSRQLGVIDLVKSFRPK